jgi:hypothetical protein
MNLPLAVLAACLLIAAAPAPAQQTSNPAAMTLACAIEAQDAAKHRNGGNDQTQFNKSMNDCVASHHKPGSLAAVIRQSQLVARFRDEMAKEAARHTAEQTVDFLQRIWERVRRGAQLDPSELDAVKHSLGHALEHP